MRGQNFKDIPSIKAVLVPSLHLCAVEREFFFHLFTVGDSFVCFLGVNDILTPEPPNGTQFFNHVLTSLLTIVAKYLISAKEETILFLVHISVVSVHQPRIFWFCAYNEHHDNRSMW